MLDEDQRRELQKDIADRVKRDSNLLKKLREEVQGLKSQVTKIQPRQAHSVSVVATDGGNNRFDFDPFFLQVVRVVDSNNNSHSIDVVSPTTDPAELLKKHLSSSGDPLTPLGRMMAKLKVKTLSDLSPMIPEKGSEEQPAMSWIPVYRELQEWAVLLELASEYKWGNATVLLFDGLLRTKKFSGLLFRDYRQVLDAAILDHKKAGRAVYVVGIGKDNQVLTRYRLAMALEEVMRNPDPVYLGIPREMEIATYKYKEWARGDDVVSEEGGEENKMVGGKLFFAKFGRQPSDSIWPVDIWQSQVAAHQAILGCVLTDAESGFPILNYPRSLQVAHENAAMIGFDMDLLRYEMFKGIRDSLGKDGDKLDKFRLQDGETASERYN